MYFETFVEFLRANGYNVKVEMHSGYKFPYQYAEVTGKGILGGFCEPNDTSYVYINGCFAADNVECFDKWSKCPLDVEFPANDNEAKQLLEMLEHLGSEEGLKYSDSYEYLGRHNRYQYAV